MKLINRAIQADFERLADSCAKSTEIYHRIAQSYCSLGQNKLFDVFSSLEDAFAKLVKSYRNSTLLIETNFTRFFRFYARELTALEELQQAYQVAQDTLNLNEKKLFKKKETLFEQKQVPKWDVEPGLVLNVDTLLKDKAIAFREMLYKESKETLKYRYHYGYMLNKLIDEFKRICLKNNNDMKAHFALASRQHYDEAERVIHIDCES